MNACGQSGGPLGSPGGSGRFLSLLATHLWDGLYLDTDPFAVHSGMGHELLPREEGRAEEGPGTPFPAEVRGESGDPGLAWLISSTDPSLILWTLALPSSPLRTRKSPGTRHRGPGIVPVCVCKAHPKADIPRASKKQNKKKESPLVTIPNMLWSPPCQEPCTLWLEPRLKSPSMLPMPSCIWRASGTPSCTPAASAVPLPIPQPGKGCLKQAGGRVYTVLGALT